MITESDSVDTTGDMKAVRVHISPARPYIPKTLWCNSAFKPDGSRDMNWTIQTTWWCYWIHIHTECLHFFFSLWLFHHDSGTRGNMEWPATKVSDRNWTRSFVLYGQSLVFFLKWDQWALRDAVLVKGLQIDALFLRGPLVQVLEELHGWKPTLWALLGDIKLLHKLQRTWTLIGELVWATVMTLTEER